MVKSADTDAPPRAGFRHEGRPKDVLEALLAGNRKPEDGPLDGLDLRDLPLWSLLAQETPAELATRLLVKDRTAKHVVASLLNKIGAGTRIEAPKCAVPGPAWARVGPRDPRGDVTGNTKMILVR